MVHTCYSRSSTRETSTALTAVEVTTLQSASPSTVELAYNEWTSEEVLATLSSSSPNEQQHQQQPPVIFLHGLLGNKKNFASLARSLSLQLQTKRRIFGLDLRNHGENTSTSSSNNHNDDMSYPAMAADVVAFLDRQNLDQVVLVGHSMGGKVAQAVALLYPERVHGLVVLDMAPVEYKEENDSTWQAVCNIVRRLDSAVKQGASTKKEVDVALRKDIPDAALRAFCLTNWDDKKGSWKIPMESITQQLHTLAAFDLQQPEGRTVSYAGDAFFIHGGQSRFVRHGHLSTIREYFPNHMLTTIRGSGHWVHAEAPENTLSLLLQFLDR